MLIRSKRFQRPGLSTCNYRAYLLVTRCNGYPYPLVAAATAGPYPLVTAATAGLIRRCDTRNGEACGCQWVATKDPYAAYSQDKTRDKGSYGYCCYNSCTGTGNQVTATHIGNGNP